jgi:Carboxypeptidase regulatory-like domain
MPRFNASLFLRPPFLLIYGNTSAHNTPGNPIVRITEPAKQGRMTFLARGITISVLLALVAIEGSAQGGPSGALSGTLEDSSHAVIANAQVEIVSAATGERVRLLSTNSSGLFTATLLPVGTYTVQVSASGFAKATVHDVAVRVTETTRLTVTLKTATVQEKVDVTAEIADVKTTDATTGSSLGSRAISTLPLATRNFQQLLALSAGASSSLNAAAQLGRGDVRIDVNGGREDNNGYQIEGIGANDYSIGELTNTPLPSPDVVQEFKVSTSLYDASQGRNGGGNINAILKSGTADFHFDLFEYFRNTDLNANDYFLNLQGLPRPVITQNIFGASAGGPIGPNGLLGYFFANYQGTRQRSGDSPGTIISTAIPVLPTDRSAAKLESVFQVPSIDPVVLKLLNVQSNQFGSSPGGFLFPTIPGTPGIDPTTGNANYGRFIRSDPGKFTDNQFTANWDRDFRNGKDRLSFRFFYTNASTNEPFGGDGFQIGTGGPPLENNLNFPLIIPIRDRLGSLAETHTFNSSVVNEFRFGVSVISSKFQNVPLPGVTAQELGINRPTNNATVEPYRFSLATFQIGPYPTETQTALGDTLSYHDTLSYVRGRHSFRFGGDYEHTDIRRSWPIPNDGDVFFTTSPGLNDFQNFLLGAPTFTDASGGVANHDYVIPAFALFAQDDYRATRNLTLNLGLRTEILGAAYDKLCHIGNTDPTLQSSTGPYFYPTCVDKFKIPALSGTATRSGLNNNYSTVWEPRIGFAYDLFGRGTTAIRAGYGIYGVREDLGVVDNLSFQPPFLPMAVPAFLPPNSLTNLFVGLIPPQGVLSPSFVPTPSFFQGFVINGTSTPTTDTTQTSVFSGSTIGLFGLAAWRHWIVPTTQQWNLTVQNNLGKGWSLEVGYVGTKGTHLRETSDRNQANLASPQNPTTITAQNGTKYVIQQNTLTNLTARAPYPGIAPTGLENFIPDSNSNYNALQLTVRHRFSKTFYLQSAYTYSKSIDDTSTASVAFNTRFNNQLTGADSRSVSDFDRPQRSITSFVHSLPFFTNSHGVLQKVLGDWQVNGLLTLQSGTPFTVFDSAGGTAYGLSTPNLVTADLAPGFNCSNSLTSGPVSSRLNRYINLNAFRPVLVVPNSPDSSTGFGNSSRNCLRGPFQKNLDFSVGKLFKFLEHQSVRFSAEFFNLTNTPSFASPSSLDVENKQTLGSISSVVGTPRIIQFSLRYSY